MDCEIKMKEIRSNERIEQLKADSQKETVKIQADSQKKRYEHITQIQADSQLKQIELVSNMMQQVIQGLQPPPSGSSQTQ